MFVFKLISQRFRFELSYVQGDIWKPMPSLIYGATGIISAICGLFLPETLLKELPDSIDEVERGYFRWVVTSKY